MMKSRFLGQLSLLNVLHCSSEFQQMSTFSFYSKLQIHFLSLKLLSIKYVIEVSCNTTKAKLYARQFQHQILQNLSQRMVELIT